MGAEDATLLGLILDDQSGQSRRVYCEGKSEFVRRSTVACGPPCNLSSNVRHQEFRAVPLTAPGGHKMPLMAREVTRVQATTKKAQAAGLSTGQPEPRPGVPLNERQQYAERRVRPDIQCPCAKPLVICVLFANARLPTAHLSMKTQRI
jgi:hypothetical protein